MELKHLVCHVFYLLTSTADFHLVSQSVLFNPYVHTGIRRREYYRVLLCSLREIIPKKESGTSNVRTIEDRTYNSTLLRTVRSSLLLFFWGVPLHSLLISNIPSFKQSELDVQSGNSEQSFPENVDRQTDWDSS